MHRISFVFWCYAILLVVAPLELQENSTSNDMTVRSDIKFIEDQRVQMKQVQYNLPENFASDDNETLPEFFTNITKENHEGDDLTEYQEEVMRNYEDNNQISDIVADSMKIKNSNYTILHEQHEDLNKNIKNKTECVNNTCIPLCCPLGDGLIKGKCVTGDGNYSFPMVYITNNLSLIQEIEDNKTIDQMFHFIINDPCPTSDRVLIKEKYGTPKDNYHFFANGSLYRPRYNTFIHPKLYCLAVHQNKYEVMFCKERFWIIMIVDVIISIPFLLATFVVYSILPELQNMHGYTLRAHVGSLFIAFIILAVLQQYTLPQLGYNMCNVLAYLFTFSFLAAFFWLNIMCIDIWRIFSKQKSHEHQLALGQRNAKYQEKRKFALYALYGWGGPFILIIIYIMIEFVLVVPKNIVRPQFCIHNRWFGGRLAKGYYFYVPVGITIICNIILFILTALTIARQKRDTQQHFRNITEDKRHNSKKQWFKMYLKLFILMGITWIADVLASNAWILNSPPREIFYLTDVINTLQGVIIFIIFVWKKKIWKLLLKRFGYQNNLF